MVKIPSNFFIVQFIFVSGMLLSYHNKLINVLCIANAIIKFYIINTLLQLDWFQ